MTFDYYAFCDQDDVWMPNKLAQAADIPRPVSFYNALIENVCAGCTVVINKETLQLVKKRIPTSLDNIIMHDWWIYLCTSSFGEVVFGPKPSIL